MQTYFDDALPRFVDSIAALIGEESLERGVILRDMAGFLSFFTDKHIDEPKKVEIASNLAAAVGDYARTDQILFTIDDFGANDIIGENAIRFPIGSRSVRLIDRRLVGADWLRMPVASATQAKRFAFVSLKGGVGRSTALAVVAAHCASRGLRVLAVDLDLEAPGIGTMLLSNDVTPEFGLLDALVEIHVHNLTSSFFTNLVGSCDIIERGRVDVLPALGARSLANPGEILPKISRAYAETLSDSGQSLSFLDNVRLIIENIERANGYDVVLLDARAGLHETSAASILGLGAELLCFGSDEPQTFVGYRALLAHLFHYTDAVEGDDSSWSSRLNIVQAKAAVDAQSREEFASRFVEMIKEISDGKPPIDEVKLPHGFGDVPWDEDVSDYDLGLDGSEDSYLVKAVLYDPSFIAFSPVEKRDQLSEEIYTSVYGQLLNLIDNSLGLRSDPS